MPINFAQEQDLVSIKVLHPVTESDFDEYTRHLNLIFGMQQYFYLLIDLSQLDDVPFKFVMKQALYMKRMQKYTKQWLQASSVVFKKPSTANLINTVFSIKKPIKPNLVTQDLTEAINFLTQNKTQQQHKTHM